MSDNYLKIFVSVFLVFTKFNLTYQAVETFYGDISFKQFLAKFCSKPPLKTKLIFISNFKFDSELVISNSSTAPNYAFKYKQFFENNKDCLYFSGISTDTFINFLKTDLNIRHNKLHVVFDFSQQHLQLNSTTFSLIIHNLTPLFTSCRKCLPFLLLFKLPQSQLLKLSLNIFKLLPIHFQGVLIDISTSSVVFIRPVLNGCDLLNNVFIPQNKSDIARLKSTKCNLNNKQLKVSVNKVGKLIYLFYF